MNDKPEAFGFFENASLAYAQNEISSLVSAIATMQSNERHNVAKSSGTSEEVAEMAITNLLTSLPSDVSLFSLQLLVLLHVVV